MKRYSTFILFALCSLLFGYTKQASKVTYNPEQSLNEYKYEAITKYNSAVNDIDSLTAFSAGVFADSLYKTAIKGTRLRADSAIDLASNRIKVDSINVVNAVKATRLRADSSININSNRIKVDSLNGLSAVKTVRLRADTAVDMAANRIKVDSLHGVSALNTVRVRADTVIVSGGVKAKFLDIDSAWEDLRFPLTTARLGATAKPDIDYTNIGLLFPTNDTTEHVICVAQMPHAWKAGSNIRPHIHWLQDSTPHPRFFMKWNWVNAGDTNTVFTLDSAVGPGEYSHVTGKRVHQISEFVEISGAGKTKSSIFKFMLYRKQSAAPNAISGNVLSSDVDIHYKVDKLGSRTEY